MGFDSNTYGQEIGAILSLDGSGERLMPLAPQACSSDEARRILNGSKARDLFPQSRHPEAAMSGLFLYFSCLDEAHTIAQDVSTPEGSWWHGIMHRQEPDRRSPGSPEEETAREIQRAEWQLLFDWCARCA